LPVLAGGYHEKAVLPSEPIVVQAVLHFLRARWEDLALWWSWRLVQRHCVLRMHYWKGSPRSSGKLMRPYVRYLK
jgi:hypothetical protein